MFKKVVSLCLSVAVAFSMGVKKTNAIDSNFCQKLCKAKNKNRINVHKKVLKNIDVYYDKVRNNNFKDDPVLAYIFKIYEEQENNNLELFDLFYRAICGDLHTCFSYDV